MELTVWNRTDTGDDFLGEVLVELREWRHYIHPTWCRLHDHDDNSPPLPRPRQLPTRDSVVSSASASSSYYEDLSRGSDHRDVTRESLQLSPVPGKCV